MKRESTQYVSVVFSPLKNLFGNCQVVLVVFT